GYGAVRALFDKLSGEDLASGAKLALPALSQTGDGDQAPFAVQHGLYWLTVDLTTVRPLALIVDDVHWCDERSLLRLGFPLRRAEDLPVLVLLAQRTGEPCHAQAALTDLLAGCLCDSLDLGPLGTGELAAIITATPGGAPSVGLAPATTRPRAGRPRRL